ncbi:MAG: hypothetical protein U5M51_14335, partial [Emticicia sp.]|nr:hypothetical protein [Emticicia sp.]
MRNFELHPNHIISEVKINWLLCVLAILSNDIKILLIQLRFTRQNLPPNVTSSLGKISFLAYTC